MKVSHGSKPVLPYLGDLDGDGKLDLLMSEPNEETIVFTYCLNEGKAAKFFRSEEMVNIQLFTYNDDKFYGGSSLALADFNGDGKLDVAAFTGMQSSSYRSFSRLVWYVKDVWMDVHSVGRVEICPDAFLRLIYPFLAVRSGVV